MARRNENNLTNKWQIFCDAYLAERELNSTRAYKVAYPRASQRTAEVNGRELLRKTEVAAYIEKALRERSERTKISADWLLRQLEELAVADLADLYDEQGGLKAVAQWPEAWRRGLVTGVKTTELYENVTNGGTGKKEKVLVGYVKEVKFTDRIKVLELLGRHSDVQAWRDKVVGDREYPLRMHHTLDRSSNWDQIRAKILEFKKSDPE